MSGNASGKLGRILLLVGRIALAAIFLVAAYAKLKPQGAMTWSPASVKISLAMFAMQVDSYQLLSTNGVNFVAHALPPFELLVGLWLLSGIALRFSSLITTLLIGGFFAVMVRTYALGLEVNCGCFGPGEQLGTKTLVRDGSLLALSLAICIGAFLVRRKPRDAGAAVGAVAAAQRAD
ncbi:MAG: MauE/DoxX family redox-associated membrane protein [Candidatus Acidiferrales bacterium]